MEIAYSSLLYLKQMDGDIILQIGQNGQIEFSSDSGYIRWASGRSVYADSSKVMVDGDFAPHEDVNHDCGTSSRRWHNVRAQYGVFHGWIECQGSRGTTDSGYGFLNGIKWSNDDHDNLKARFAEIEVKGGIITGFDEGSYYTVGT
jgi:hypothetical protein